MVKIMVVIKWFYLAKFSILKTSLCDPSHWMTINITSPTLHFKSTGGATLIEDVGDLKLWYAYNPSYMPWVIVETTVCNENDSPASW